MVMRRRSSSSFARHWGEECRAARSRPCVCARLSPSLSAFAPVSACLCVRVCVYGRIRSRASFHHVLGMRVWGGGVNGVWGSRYPHTDVTFLVVWVLTFAPPLAAASLIS